MSKFEEPIKVSDSAKCWLLVLTICTMAFVFGYSRGVDKVQDEAVDKGYAKNDKGFAWKSRRLISQGMVKR